MDTITTTTVGAGFAEAEEVILTETAQTITAFRPQIHEGGVRGSIVRYKKDRNGNPEMPASVDFRRIDAGEGIEIELKTDAVAKLTQHIQELQVLLAEEGVRAGTHRYQVAEANDIIITDQNKAQIIQQLLEADLGEDVWDQLAISNPDLSTRLAYSKLHEERSAILTKFEDMLNDNTLVESDWQSFFEENTWIFGYGLRYQFLRVVQDQPNYGGTAIDGQGGQRGDFLTATEAETKFTCLVEIKKPDTLLLQNEQYRNGAWGISKELAGAVSQVQVNCAEWEITGARTEQNRERLNELNTVSPKGIVVIGNTNELETFDKKNSFERFRREIRNPEIITYDELFERARFIVRDNLEVEQTEDEDLPF